ncbi:type VII secretion protein EsaA [Bacillus sp. FSL R5-0654]|uniref:type VII secretion protein EsaA n=1 Tax=Bacillus TaxID=1386 RepID=UPI00163C6B9D|nr:MULTISPECIES: type VII secretion protein EsaA [Bacillus]MCY7568170.1 type VII secretion protein EsaA [Bacillus safensis]QNH46847.1 type VII secretion protein EsaA [Bacillus sp. PAMC28571]QNK44703.1 type VII secretion protein EsaA [Bacillus sp. PAMC22265]QWS49770.1 type VII secretion protein EsaA [Bacillus sp. JNUCC-24]WLW68803.1 type VII secretion protein EsaA [Bacillus safensis]
MTEQQKSSIKIVSTMILILVLPVLFFHLIGDDPAKQKKNATRNIAVVNEDMGASESENTARFGQDVVAALSERPDYTWTVVNRSAAENGLKNRKYDAVLYIPSDFSKNVLSYDKDHPEKASIQFSIQDQLNAVNKEKVQRELENAQKKMNEQMSTLYWSFVSQEIGNVREEFEHIVGKEVEFQNTMYNFYKPNSNKLSDAVQQQKKQIEELKNAMADSQKQYKDGLSTTEEAKNRLKDFVKVVDQYQQYQDKQKDLLIKAQSASQKQIQQGLKQLADIQNQNARSFSDQMGGLKTDINGVQSQLKTTDSAIQSVQKSREDVIPDQSKGLAKLVQDSQEELIKTYEKRYLDYYKNKIIVLQNKLDTKRQELINASKPPEDDNDDDSSDQDNENPEEIGINLDEETNELSQISTEMNDLADQLADQETPPTGDNNDDNTGDDPAQPDTGSTNSSKDDLKALATRLDEVKKKIQEKAAAHNDELKDKVSQINEELKDLSDKIDKLEKKFLQLQDRYNVIPNEIKNQESSILSKVKELKQENSPIANAFNIKIFDQEFETNTRNTKKLMEYSNQLSQLEMMLNDLYEPSNNSSLYDAKEENIQSILSIKKEETENWDKLKNQMLTSNDDVSTFIDEMQKFSDGYAEYITTQQASMEQELQTISESADNVAEQMADQGDAVYTADLAGSSIVVSAQDSIGQEVLRLSENMSSLTDRQKGVADYTNNIEESVTTVQEKADTLNENWSKNVDSTKLVQQDLKGILGNTLSDQGNSNYVYNHLANPLKISGDVPEEKTQTVPPVVILVIVMISSLLIGFFSSYYASAPMLVKGALFGILNLLVGLMISLFGLNIYKLADDQAIQWSIFTILLLVACSAFIRTAFLFGSIAGWMAATALIFFFVAPLIDLVMPNFHFTNPVTDVYLSIQYGNGDTFGMGVTGLVILTVLFMVVPLVKKLWKDKTEERDVTHEA